MLVRTAVIGPWLVVALAACEGRGVAFVPEVFEISQRVTADPELVATDGLHPSGTQYARWVDAIEPVVRALLERGGASASDG